VATIIYLAFHRGAATAQAEAGGRGAGAGRAAAQGRNWADIDRHVIQSTAYTSMLANVIHHIALTPAKSLVA
jgi:hypothetical protein